MSVINDSVDFQQTLSLEETKVQTFFTQVVVQQNGAEKKTQRYLFNLFTPVKVIEYRL